MTKVKQDAFIQSLVKAKSEALNEKPEKIKITFSNRVYGFYDDDVKVSSPDGPVGMVGREDCKNCKNCEDESNQ